MKECLERTGEFPVGVRWVDVNLGEDVHPEYRSRVVAKELFSMALSEGLGYGMNWKMKLDFIDVKRAFFKQRLEGIFSSSCHRKIGRKGCVASCANLCASRVTQPGSGRWRIQIKVYERSWIWAMRVQPRACLSNKELME